MVESLTGSSASVQRGGDWVGLQLAQAPYHSTRCTKCNSPRMQWPAYQSPYCCIMVRCSAFFCRAMLCKRSPPVCPSPTFVKSVKTNKHIFKFFHHQLAKLSNHSSFSVPNVMAIEYSDGYPLTGVSNAGGVGTNRDSGRIAGYRSMNAAVRDQRVRPVISHECDHP